MKKVLFIVGGITCQLYAKEDLLANKNFNSGNYDEIIEIDCEQHFDSWSIHTPIWDIAGDIIKAYANPLRIRAARDEIERQAFKFHNEHKTFLTHSLGTVLLAGSRVFSERVIMCGSPLSFPFKPLKAWVQNELCLYPWGRLKHGLWTPVLYYLYSRNDKKVCNHLLDDKFAQALSDLTYQYEANLDNPDGHSWTGYVDEVIKRGLV